MSKLSVKNPLDNVLPLINYSLSARLYPDSTKSQEQLPLENSLETTPYSDFTSTIYDIPNPCEIVHKKPLYAIPSEMNFAKAYIDWLLLRQGASRKDFRAKTDQISRVLFLQFDLELPLIPKFMDPDYWLNNSIIIPTHYVDIDNEQFMCFKFQGLILMRYTISISVDKINTIRCTVFGYNPEIVFFDKLPTDLTLFENWISKIVEIHTYPDDIGLVSNNIVFSATVSLNSNLSIMTYKETTELKDVWYIYEPKKQGSFNRIEGFITLSDYPVSFDPYDWIVIQSQPQFDISVELFDPDYKLSKVLATKLQIHFKNKSENKNKDNLLGSIYVYVTDASFDMYRVRISGFGRYEPGDL